MQTITTSNVQQRKTTLGFTLVELLVVITIIGILIALLLPAVQAAREAARRLQCTNNVKQLALGCIGHEQAHGFFPSGGIGGQLTLADPDLGVGRAQPGGWVFSILPYIEQQTLHDMGAGGSVGKKMKLFAQREQTPIGSMNCPSRRLLLVGPVVHPTTTNGALLTAGAKGDYGANAGDTNDPQNTSLLSIPMTGICFHTSQVEAAAITDGLSNTYLVGEKAVRPEDYITCISGGDDDTIYWGGNADTLRTAVPSPVFQDTEGVDPGFRFGSAHAGGFNMGLCDGSVSSISYSIDPVVHSHLGNRKDNCTIDGSKL